MPISNQYCTFSSSLAIAALMSMLVKALVYSTVLRHFKTLMLLDFSEVFFVKKQLQKSRQRKTVKKTDQKCSQKEIVEKRQLKKDSQREAVKEKRTKKDG